MVVGYQAGRDGFWLARWLSARGIEVYVMHSTGIAVSREHRRAKTDRLDIGLRIMIVDPDRIDRMQGCGANFAPNSELPSDRPRLAKGTFDPWPAGFIGGTSIMR